jgi:hypothetical protein
MKYQITRFSGVLRRGPTPPRAFVSVLSVLAVIGIAGVSAAVCCDDGCDEVCSDTCSCDQPVDGDRGAARPGTCSCRLDGGENPLQALVLAGADAKAPLARALPTMIAVAAPRRTTTSRPLAVAAALLLQRPLRSVVLLI